MIPVALTIAGSDPSGGAGIQADLKTFHQFGVYGEAVITLLTVQNTQRVSSVVCLDPDLIRQQTEAVLEDIPPGAAKTGALGNAAIIETVAKMWRGLTIPLVVDPVMISKHGASLITEEARTALIEQLIPMAAVVTPNLHEAGALAGFAVDTVDGVKRAAEQSARSLMLGENAARRSTSPISSATPVSCEISTCRAAGSIGVSGSGSMPRLHPRPRSSLRAPRWCSRLRR